MTSGAFAQLAAALAALLASTGILAGCAGPNPVEARPDPSSLAPAVPAPVQVIEASLLRGVGPARSQADDADATPTWVASHAVTSLWDGPLPDAATIARLPVGSFFLVRGSGTAERLPVAYPGNSTLRAVEAWIDVAAIGPIPAPGPDWIEPEWPPRRLVVGRRGEVIRGDPALPLVALTFDAGAGSGATSELLDVLRDRGVRATFFIAGAFADRYPDLVARMALEGHELANHSYSHPDFRNLTEQQMRIELRRGTASIEAATGVRIAPLWRPPFGSRDDRILQIVEEEGFRSVFWTFDSGDWLTTATTDRVRTAVLNQAVAGAVVVHHVSPTATARAMPAIVDELRRRGYELVTVSDVIGP